MKKCPICYDPHLGMYERAYERGYSNRHIAQLVELTRKTYARGGTLASRDWYDPAPVQTLRTIESQVRTHFTDDDHNGQPGSSDSCPELPRDFYVEYA